MNIKMNSNTTTPGASEWKRGKDSSMIFGLVFLLLIGGLMLSRPVVAGDDDGYSVTDENSVYYGNAENVDNPIVVDFSDVLKEIPEWQEIQDRGLDRDDSEYWVLYREALENFYKAVRTVCKKNNYDLAAEVGTVKTEGDAPPPPEKTNAVINALPSNS